MGVLISVVIPNFNSSRTISACLDSVFSSRFNNYEVIVVDDCSEDASPEIIKEFPCRLYRLEEHSGAAAARNHGARKARGEIIFFTDSDCLLQPGTLERIRGFFESSEDGYILGGTYTPLSQDRRFFSDFQSVFIHYSETKHPESPDYIPTHAMAIKRSDFFDIGGFDAESLPILEDVEFSHRARQRGYRLLMDPGLQVVHIFNYDLLKSLKNGFRKSLYWTLYSLKRKDMMRDSGTASIELKTHGLFYIIEILLLYFALASNYAISLPLLALALLSDLYINRRLFSAFYRAGGIFFALKSLMYYQFIYPLSVITGGGLGLLCYILKKGSSP